MKVLVGFPPTLSAKGTPLLSQNRQFQYFDVPTFLFPVAMGTAATMARDKYNHDVIWYDAISESMDWDDFDAMIRKESPEIFFFETKAPVVKKHWEAVHHLKQKFPKLKIVICGDHVTYRPKETMEKCPIDFVINGGYYDFAFCELLDYLSGKRKNIPQGVWYRKNGKIIDNGKYDFKGSLDQAPIVDRVLTKNKNYQKEFNLKGRPLAYIMSGRDCWYGKCTFCVWDQTLYPRGKFRARSPENVLEEVKYLVDNQGVREIFDDCGTITVGPWLKKFCNLMIESGYNKKVMYSCNMRFGAVDAETYKLMKKAGFRLLKYGLESGCQKTIDKLDKGTKISEVLNSCRDAKKAGLTVHLTMMVGYPWETKEDAMETWKLSKKLMLKGYADVLQSTVIVPYPGTPLYEEGKDKNWFRFNPEDYERFDMTEPVFKTPDMTPQEVQALCQMNYKIYIDPRYMFQHIKRIKTWEDVRYTFDGIKAVLGHIKDFARPVKN
jgi:anaerobic magnesium-protoporphyrin IX monomethyl ester cyclase